jgi:phosphohistidine swiveling domain-containing protein
MPDGAEITVTRSPTAPKMIVHPGDTSVEESDIGGKASGLTRLLAQQLEVPPFFIVRCAAFRAHLATGEVSAALGRVILSADDHAPDAPDCDTNSRSSELRRAIGDLPLAMTLEEEIATALNQLGPGPYAVRSSMVGEDSARHSFAGQLETRLHQRDLAEVMDSIRDCWASAFSERALTYAARVGISPASVRMGVIVQQMVEAETSGVLFTTNPLNGRHDESLVSAAFGLGEGIVSGICDADQYTWTDGKGMTSANVARKEVAIRRAATGRGTEEVPVAEGLRDRQVLSTDQIEELCQAGAKIAEDRGVPVDIEWCHGRGRLYVLQARPITTLSTHGDPHGAAMVFDNSNIQESYCGITTPLTFSFALQAYESTFLRFAKTFGASDTAIAAFQPAARNLLSLVEGRVYYNLHSWYRLLRIFPGFNRNKEDTEKNWHVEESVTIQAEVTSGYGALRGRLERARIGFSLILRYARLDREVKSFVRRFDEVYDRVDRSSLGGLDMTQLVATGDMLSRELLDHWDTPNINDFRVMMSCGRLRRLLERQYADAAEGYLADLLSGIDGIESVRPTQVLMEIASLARSEPRIVEAINERDPYTALKRLRVEFPSFAGRIDQYIDRYGDRAVGELKLETVTLRENPAFLFDILCGYLKRPDLDPAALAEQDRERFATAYKEVSHRIGPIRRLLLPRQVRTARKAVKAREELRLLRTLAFGLARDVFCAMGHRLHEARVLDDPRDIFYLTVDELRGYHEARAVSADLAGIVVARKLEYAGYERSNLPNRIETTGSPYLSNDYRIAPLAPDDARRTATELSGLGCCAGVVEAPVRIIFDPSDTSLDGQILCTIRTDPGWAPLFPLASGLIVERGSALSHSAVVARELGLPTVVGVRDVTQLLNDGEQVRLDGHRGTVERLEHQAPTDH